MSELTSTPGIVALAAAVLALVSLVLAAVLVAKLRALRAGQQVVLGEGERRDLIEHANALERRVEELTERSRRAEEEASERFLAAEQRLDRSLSRSSVVRYDAYNEMSGRQSSSIAILDDNADGVLLSAILHREQARFYAKRVSGGDSELGISPEERQAMDEALARARMHEGQAEPGSARRRQAASG